MQIWRLILLVVAASAAAAAGVALVTQPAGMALGALWHQHAAASLNLTQAVVQRYVYAPLWTGLFVPLLMEPAAAVFAGIALLAGAALLWRRRRAR